MAVRLPLLAQATGVPVDGDTAIIGLMALHREVGGTMWGQPYGSPVESWLVLPFVEALGPTRFALRLAYLFLSLGLVPLAFLLARALQPGAGLPAALVLACPPALLLAWSSLPQPLYPATLLLGAASLAAALAAEGRLAEAGGRYRGPLAAWAVLGVLAVWTHFVSLMVVGAGALLLAWRARGAPRRLGAVLAALALALLPAVVLLARGSGTAGVLAAGLEHARAVAPGMHVALSELLGGRTAAVPDISPEIVSPAWVRLALAVLYLGGAALALRCRRRAAALALWAAVALVALVFPFPLRSETGAVRFLTPAYLPLAVLAVAGAARRSAATAWALAGLLALLHLVPAPALVVSWRQSRSTPAPGCTAARAAMEVLGVRRGYASYETAYCVTYESGERLVLSQPWNERFGGHPLKYLDEVRFATSAVWILNPEVDFGMPAPGDFEPLLQAAGGSWQRSERGPFTVYHSFVPPFADAAAEATPRRCEGEGALVLPLPEPTALLGLTILAPGGGALPPRLTVETSADGRSFETAWSRRRPQALTKLVWLNGLPRWATDPAAVAVSLPANPGVAALRLTSPDADACSAVGPVLLHRDPPGPSSPDPLGPDTSWPERRRILAERPQPGSAGWHYRERVADGHR